MSRPGATCLEHRCRLPTAGAAVAVDADVAALAAGDGLDVAGEVQIFHERGVGEVPRVPFSLLPRVHEDAEEAGGESRVELAGGEGGIAERCRGGSGQRRRAAAAAVRGAVGL